MAARNAQTLTVVPPSTAPDDRIRDKRARLAEAQAAIKRSEAAEEQTRTVVARAREQVSRARDNLGRAQEAIAAAKVEQERRLVEAAKSGKTIDASTTTTRDLRAAELEAQDQVDAAVAALATVEQSVGDPEQATEAVRQLDLYVGSVLWTQAERLYEEAKAMQAGLIERRAVLRYLLHEFKSDDARLREPTDELVRMVRDFLRYTPDMPSTFGGTASLTDWDRHPATQPWRQAREALAKDAEAVLPER